LNSEFFKLIKEKLSIGQEIKNYPDFCKLLNQQKKRGNAQKAQLKEWQRYFNYKKDGNKFIILEIYTEPLPKTDGREDGKGIYNIYIEKLILDLLVQKYQSKNDDKRKIYLSKDKMLLSLNMVNINYHFVKYNVADTANYIKVDNDNIKEFYNINNRNFNDTVERALNRLSNKFLVNWKLTQTVATTNEDMSVIFNKNKGELELKEIHRDATDEERVNILMQELNVAKQMGFEKKSDIFLCGRYLEFTGKVCKNLQKEGYNILYYYNSYDIIFHEEVIKELDKINQYILEYEERQNVKVTLNGIISNQIIKNTESRHNEAKKELPPIRFGKRRINKYDYKQVQLIRRSDDSYITDTNKIIDTVINYQTKDITIDIIKYNQKENEKMEQQLEELFYGDDE